jgi:hypothetical protein
MSRIMWEKDVLLNGCNNSRQMLMQWYGVTTGPYMEQLYGGSYVPEILDDGTRVFAAPLGKGHVPIVSLVDIGFFARYIFDHPAETSGKELKVRTKI